MISKCKYILLIILLPLNNIGQVLLAEKDAGKQIIPYNLKRVARLTGKTQKGEDLPNPNRTDEKYNVGGTDLGIAWDMGKGKTGFFFGDTYGKAFLPVKGGGPGEAGDWRSNILAISTDQDPSDGISFDTIIKRQIIYSPHILDGTGSHTAIPTAAIHAGGMDYVHYMDVRKWGAAGRWSTNFSALYKSADSGKNWHECKQVRFDENSNFAQIGYAKKDGFVYMAGTRSGRSGAIFLARFKENKILDQTAYQYWNSTKGWVEKDELSATPIIDDPSGELSICYHDGYKRWIITYISEKARALVMRDASDVTGIWSEPKILVKSSDYPGLYGSYILPLKPERDSMYFSMSMWWPYNVFLMKVNLKLSE